MSKAKNKVKIRKYDKHYKIISILIIVIALLLFFSFVSYSKADESNSQVSFGELLSLFFGNEEIKAKAATTHNWLSLFGAVIANFFFKKTVGFWIIALPYFMVMWSWILFVGKEIPTKLIKNTSVYFILIILFAGLTGTLQQVNWVFPIPYEMSGNIGQFLAEIFSSIIGTLGSFLIFTAGIVVTLILGTDIQFGKYFKLGSDMANNLKENSKDIVNDIKNDIKIKTEKKKEEQPEPKINNFKNEEPQTQKIESEIEETDVEEEKIENSNIHVMKKSPNIRIFRPKQIKDPNELVSKQDMEKENKIEEENSILENIEEDPVQKTETKHESTPIVYLDDDNEDTDDTEDIENNDKIEETDSHNDVILSEPSNENKQLNISIEKQTSSIQIDDENDEDDNDIEENQEETDNRTILQEDAGQTNIKINKKVEKRGPINLLGTDIHDEKIDYTPPGFDLLDQVVHVNDVSEAELKTNAQILQEKLETFKIYIEDLGITPGPVVTQYEFVPAPGIKISKIESLSDDLAMALKAKGIRIIAPIPEKGTVGIEIPNAKPSTVTFYDVAKSEEFLNSNAALPLAMGKMIDGSVFTIDLAKMPHLLIAGSTGSGKSVGINTIIASIIYKKHPSEVKFVLVDPKKVELMQYSLLRDHFLAVSPDIDSEIVNTPTDAVIVLKATVVEMERRYDILSKVGQRNIKDYNKKVREGRIKDSPDLKHRPMPYIVVIIDELADLMLTASKEVETPITRLAQMARAVGIHLIIATQRPSVDVITGLIKANFPARIAYAVASKIDSRTILDMQGADTLLGMGDMLCLPSGQPKPIRIQNSFIDTDEVENICNFISEQVGYSEPYLLPSLNEPSQNATGISLEDRDSLFEEAARVIIRSQQGSVSLLQRRLKIGYARAGRIVDELEAAGIVGPFDGSKARQVLMDSESELEAVL